MLKKAILVLMLSLVLVFTSACGNSGKQVSTATETPLITPKASVNPNETTATSDPKETISPKPTPPQPQILSSSFIRPDSEVRPVAVMIDNQGDKVLPQGGISQAQIVYEMLVEYNITRYLAFFWGTMPEIIGPVRSSRHYFLDYSMEYDAVYTHFGWSEYARKDITKFKIQNINGLVNGEAFWDITKDKGNWQDSFTSKERIEKQISSLKYRTEPIKLFPFKYEDEFKVNENGMLAEDIFIKFSSNGVSTCGFIYDAENGNYRRFRMGKPHIERNTNEQVKATNIIIQEVSSPPIENDTAGRRNLLNIGSGNGWFITGGKAIPVKWSKSARDAQTTYKTDAGEQIKLNEGQTWIEIVPTLDYVKIN